MKTINVFKENDTVWLLDQGEGTLVEAMDGYYVVELRNGVELDFTDQSKFLTQAEYDEKKFAPTKERLRKQEEDKNNIVPSARPFVTDLFQGIRHPSYKDDKFLDYMANHRIGRAMYNVMRDNIIGFNEMDSFHKMRATAEFWRTPMMFMRESVPMDMIDICLRKMIVENTDKIPDLIMEQVRRAVDALPDNLSIPITPVYNG